MFEPNTQIADEKGAKYFLHDLVIICELIKKAIIIAPDTW